MLSLWRQSTYCFRALCNWFNPVAYVSNVVVVPAATVLLFALIGRYSNTGSGGAAYAIGLTAFGATRAMAGGVIQCVAGDRLVGTLPFLVVSSGSRFKTFISRALPNLPNALICFAIGLAACALLLHLDFGATNWPLLLLSYGSMSLSMAAFSLLLGAFAIAFVDFWPFSATAETLVLTLTGAVIPLAAMPSWLQALAHLLPVTNGLTALRGAVVGEATLSLAPAIAAELALAVGYCGLGYAVFRAMLSYARRTGALDHV
jgi:ABC-2 type transport system permease protein